MALHMGTVTVVAKDIPAVKAELERLRAAIKEKDAALRLFLEREHPDEGCRLACPGDICIVVRSALEVGY
jgi:hypothetical protein